MTVLRRLREVTMDVTMCGGRGFRFFLAGVLLEKGGDEEKASSQKISSSSSSSQSPSLLQLPPSSPLELWSEEIGGSEGVFFL